MASRLASVAAPRRQRRGGEGHRLCRRQVGDADRPAHGLDGGQVADGDRQRARDRLEDRGQPAANPGTAGRHGDAGDVGAVLGRAPEAVGDGRHRGVLRRRAELGPDRLEGRVLRRLRAELRRDRLDRSILAGLARRAAIAWKDSSRSESVASIACSSVIWLTATVFGPVLGPLAALDAVMEGSGR